MLILDINTGFALLDEKVEKDSAYLVSDYSKATWEPGTVVRSLIHSNKFVIVEDHGTFVTAVFFNGYGIKLHNIPKCALVEIPEVKTEPEPEEFSWI